MRPLTLTARPPPANGDGLADPVARIGPREDRVFEDGVEAAFAIVVGVAIAGCIEARGTKPYPVEIERGFGSDEAGANARRAGREKAVPVLAERAIGAAGQVDTANVAVERIADISDVIVATAQVTQQRGTYRKAIGIDLDLVALAIAVVRDGKLAGQPYDRKVLAIDIGGENIVIARTIDDAVQPRIRVFFKPPEGGEIILPPIIVAVAEQADAKLRILEQEARGNPVDTVGCPRGCCRNRTGPTCCGYGNRRTLPCTPRK